MTEKQYKLCIIGPPGSGKGTICEIISEEFNLTHLSVGDMLREHIQKQDELGKQVEQDVKQGQLVPDHITEEIITLRLEKNDVKRGFIIDGFPRDINQAQFILKTGKLDGVIVIELEDQAIIKRLTQRMVCPSCGHTYHLSTKPPKEKGICDECETKLIRRKDDKPEIIQERLNTYHKKTEPILNLIEKENMPLLKLRGDLNLKQDRNNITNSIINWQKTIQEK
ncbi:MAG: adenylate kinase family protein [Nanobdellota archaeon]